MRIKNVLFLWLLFFSLNVRLVFSQEEPLILENDAGKDAGESAGGSGILKRGLIASAETMIPNVIMVSYNSIIKREPWARPGVESIRRNFSNPWKWEANDGFKVNQIGHPIQGSIYYNAGRVNNFNFYQSAFFSLLGSFVWEAFGESNGASINDVFTTVTGSISIGEMTFRLFREVCAAGIPAVFPSLFNPMAGFHQLVTNWNPRSFGINTGGNIYHFQAFLGMSYASSDYTVSSVRQDDYSFHGFAADIGFKVIYGNPFEQESRTPFDHFEFAMSLGIDYGNYMGVRLISDGYLFSFSPVYTEIDRMSTGLTLHFDFVSEGRYSLYEGTVNQYSNALDWTIKYQRLFSENISFQEKFHAGFTFMGVSDYYAPDTSKLLIKNYGYGVNVKNSSSIEHVKFGKIEMDVFYYVLWSYHGTSDLSQAVINWCFINAAYSRNITKHFSLGVTFSSASEWGFFSKSGFPDTRNFNKAVKLFFAWNI
jgi:hypothetical protein